MRKFLGTALLLVLAAQVWSQAQSKPMPSPTGHGLFLSIWEWLRVNQQSLAAVVATLTIVGFIWKIVPLLNNAWQARWARKRLPHTMGASLYTPQEIDRATKYYIESDCQSVDPSGGEDFRQVFATRENAFKALDHLLFKEHRYRHTLVLADAGMGKSSLFINYYARHIRSKQKLKQFQIGIIPLGIPNVVEEIRKFVKPSETVLFLDALDEDTSAIKDHKKRLAELLESAIGFRHVVISCRTQFFLSDEEIPKDVGIVRFGITEAGESRYYQLNKIYLSPFSDKQVIAFLKKKFSMGSKRRRAKRIANQLGDLSARPMLLAHIEDLLSQNRTFAFSCEIYEEMVEAWLKREERFVSRDLLREFSELVARDIYRNRATRQTEKISYQELLKIADTVSPEVVQWQDSSRSLLTNRSLLNRDAEGNRKFSHRSIMEYLFVCRAVRCTEASGNIPWTDQMKKFWSEMLVIAQGDLTGRSPGTGDIRPIKEAIDVAITAFRSTPAFFTGFPAVLKIIKLIVACPLNRKLMSLEMDEGKTASVEMLGIPSLGLDWFFLPKEELSGTIVSRLSFRYPTMQEAAFIHWTIAIHLGYLIADPGILFRKNDGRITLDNHCVEAFFGKIEGLKEMKFPTATVVEVLFKKEPADSGHGQNTTFDVRPY